MEQQKFLYVQYAYDEDGDWSADDQDVGGEDGETGVDEEEGKTSDEEEDVDEEEEVPPGA